MRIFYTLFFILLLGIQVSGQERTPADRSPVVKVVKFYPNPATSFITFDFKQADEKQYNQLSLQIYNLIGKKVHEVTKITQRTIINLDDFYRGVYVFQLRDKSGKVVDSGKFQVAR